ncbi:MAG: heme NO-binding domain-containing protein [Candidatus Binatia bacterium]
MKGTIVVCLKELVISAFGEDKWNQSVIDAGLSKYTVFTQLSDVDDKKVLEVLGAVCKNCNLTPLQAADAFGDYWVNVYALKLYKPYYDKHTNAKDFLCGLDDLHTEITKTMRNARPPQFIYTWKDDKTLLMQYKSPRNLMDIFQGLAKAVGKFFKTNLAITRVGSDSLQIVFP